VSSALHPFFLGSCPFIVSDPSDLRDVLPAALAARVEIGHGGCLLWTGARLPLGYGVMRYQGRIAYAHRVAWTMIHGPIPEGLVLDHLCRNPSCINPDHLEPVTQQENIRRGGSARLTQAQVDEIRRRRTAGEATGVLAAEYGVCRSHILRIAKGQAWKPIGE
jgi:hypothetical protein